MTLSIENDEFLHSLNDNDKKIVKKTIDLYYDFLDYKDALKINKSIENGTMKTFPADEVFKRLDKKYES